MSDSTPDIREWITLSATVSNIGNGAAEGTHLRYYQSTDATITSSDTQLATDAVSTLAPSGISPEWIGLTAPATAGTYYYGACVDAVSGESNTSNNCSRSVKVEAEDRADLYVWNEQIIPNSDISDPGVRFRLRVSIHNLSLTDVAPETTLRWYRSTDATITTSDTEFGTTGVGSLGTRVAVIRSIWTNAPTSAGVYYYGACADPIPNEPDTTNNCSGSVRLTVIQ